MNNDYNFSVKRKRPEEIYDRVQDYYKGENLFRYAKSKSMIKIQEKITVRALELLNLSNKNSLILDAGCGPGFTSIYLREIGHSVIALDIISEFLYFYDIKELNPIAADMCFPPFKSSSFDAIISISALQWIYRKLNNKVMHNKLVSLAKSFNNILKKNSKAIFQFYPKAKTIMDEIGKIFIDNTNFSGKFVIDNPNNPKKRKIFLVLKKE